jgi:hypothetical protein
MAKQKLTKKQIEDYILFLEKAIASKNLKNNNPIKYEAYKVKLDGERLKLKLLFTNK